MAESNQLEFRITRLKWEKNRGRFQGRKRYQRRRFSGAAASGSLLDFVSTRKSCRAQRSVAYAQVLLEKFVSSFASAPSELILDFDSTDDRGSRGAGGTVYHCPFEF